MELNFEDLVMEVNDFNLKQHLNNFEKINLIVNKELYLVNIIESLKDSISIITIKSQSVTRALETQKEINESKGIFFKIKNIFKDSETKNLDIYKFKYDNFIKIYAQLCLLKDEIKRINFVKENLF